MTMTRDLSDVSVSALPPCDGTGGNEPKPFAPEANAKATEGLKFDTGKVRFDLLPVRALEGVAMVLTYGAKKYSDRNWEKGIAYGRLFRAVMGHVWAWWRGVEVDEESGLHPLDHALCDLMMLREMTFIHPELDDRPTHTPAPHVPGSTVFISTQNATLKKEGGQYGYSGTPAATVVSPAQDPRG